MIEVVDYHQQFNAQYSHNSGNAICYYGVNGQKWPSKQIEGSGFSQGETVQVVVNLAAKKVQWIVEGTQRAT